MQESLAMFGTIAFGREFIRKHIGYGEISTENGRVRIDPSVNPEKLSLGIWLAAVPNEYLKPVKNLISAKVSGKFVGKSNATPGTLDRFADELSESIGVEVIPDNDYKARFSDLVDFGLAAEKSVDE